MTVNVHYPIATTGNPSIQAGHNGNDEGDGGDNGELAEQNHSSRASRLTTAQYLTAKALAMADCQISYAEELYRIWCNSRSDVNEIAGLFDYYKRYKASYSCGMANANADVLRQLNREMNSRLAATSMYQNGKTRDIIEGYMGRIVDESAPQLAMAYREEERLEDLTYYSFIKAANSVADKSSLYVGTAAMGSVAENQLLLAAKAARATEKNISSAVSLAVRAVDYLRSNKDKFFPTSAPAQATPSDQFGNSAPVRPDNPGGYIPGGGVGGTNVNVGGGAASIPSGTPLFTTGR